MSSKVMMRGLSFIKLLDFSCKLKPSSSFYPPPIIIGSDCFCHTNARNSGHADKNVFMDNERENKMSKAMRAYLKQSIEHEKFISQKVTEYEIGKRHLANMMGEDPETYSQDDIDNAISYLFPSGLYEPKARPIMKHPSELFAKRKAAEFDESGRPFHSLFYTGRPAFYSLIQEIAVKAMKLNKLGDTVKEEHQNVDKFFDGSKWIKKHQLEKIIMEPVSDHLFSAFIKSMDRLVDHPLATSEKDFIMKFRETISSEVTYTDIPQLLYTQKGIPYMTASGRRRTAFAEVTVYGQGSGKISVNGEDILYFEAPQDREQVMFPLQFTGNLRTVDVEATATGGGKSGQAGAIRFALAMALRSFVHSDVIEKMRIAGLLTPDRRRKERNKPGQRRARAKFTWKKR